MKLMIVGVKLGILTADEAIPLTGYQDCLNRILCKPQTPECFLGSCDDCRSLENFKEMLYEVLNDSMIDDIQYNQWISTDRTNLETIIQTADEFVETFCDKLDVLRSHEFIAKQQSAYCRERKECLAEGEFLVIGDFAENYSFVLQDEAQGFHWNNAQATLHPFVCYYKENDELKHISFVIISDCLIHDAVAIHLFQKHLIIFLTNRFNIKRIIYFSDGPSSQYKNCKNFINLCHHKVDFGVDAEWHFFATSHGKGPCDGVGGTIKRLAARASLQRPYHEQIMTPRQLYEFAEWQMSLQYSTISVQKKNGKLSVKNCLNGLKKQKQFRELGSYMHYTQYLNQS